MSSSEDPALVFGAYDSEEDDDLSDDDQPPFPEYPSDPTFDHYEWHVRNSRNLCAGCDA
jgi:hypothetical protein